MMLTSIAIAAGYLIVGGTLWKRIVVAGKAHPAPDGPEQAADAMEHALWRLEAEASEAHGAMALLIPKATFVLLWPLAICFGFAVAQFTR